MKIIFYKLLILSPILLLSWGLGGCFMNDNAATASIRNSDNQLAMERARLDAQQAAQEAQARAEMQQAIEQTNQQRIDQLGAAERLYSQQNYLIAKQSEGTNRLLIVMGALVFMIVLVGGGWLFLYLRMNPQPVARPMQQLQWLQPVPKALLSSQRAIEAGWYLSQDEWGNQVGQRVKPNGVTQRVNLLEDGQA